MEYNTRLSELRQLDYSSRIVPEAAYDDLDLQERDRLREMIRINNGESLLLDLNNEDLDKALSLVREIDGKLTPTVAGLLVLGKSERLKELIPTAQAVFQVLEGTDVRENADIRLPILASFEDITRRFEAWNPEQEFEEG